MLIIDGVKFKNGTNFMMKYDRRQYVVITVHNDNTVSYDLVKNTHFEGRVKGSVDTWRISNEDFRYFFRKTVESEQERLIRKAQECRTANSNFAKMSDDFDEAIKYDILMEASWGNFDRALAHLDALIAETRQVAYDDGHDDGVMESSGMLNSFESE